MNSSYLPNYLNELKNLISNNLNLKLIQKLILVLKKIKKKNKIMIFGNGGSAAIANHFMTDMSKNTNIKCISLSDTSLITCLANDYGYENLNQKYIEYCGNSGDVLIAISSSGESKNMINACKKAKKLNLDNQVNFELSDYRAVKNQYEKIVSVGAFEHFGKKFYTTFF